MTPSLTKIGKMLSLLALFLGALETASAGAQEQGKLSEFKDDAYAYRFLYPTEWKLESLPDGEKNPAMRVRLQGPGGSSFVVVVEKTGQPLSKLEFQADPQAKKRVETMMRQTLEQTYRAISKNLGALSMKTGERLNLTDDSGVKFYLATLNQMKTGSPVVLAGTHVFPFSKDYSLNFIMTALHRGDPQEAQILTAVFNSFRLVDSSPAPPK
jgi:hypothetical protein